MDNPGPALDEAELDEASYYSVNEREKDAQGSHVCFEIPSNKDTAEWFDFDHFLIKAAMLGCDKCVDLLIKAGANVNATDDFNCTALLKAARHGHAGCVELLLAAGADMSIPDKFGTPALNHAVDNWNFLRMVGETVGDQDVCAEMLLRRIGDDVNMCSEGSETPLMSVASLGDVGWLSTLINAGADVNRRDGKGETAVMKAAENDHPECLSALVQAGASVNEVCRDGWTALMHAAANVSDECVKLLIEAGADTKDDADHSFIALMVQNGTVTATESEALSRGTFFCLQQFLKVGAFVNRGIIIRCSLELFLSSTSFHKGQVPMLMLAAGEMVKDKYKEEILRDYLKQDDQDKLSLKHMSREAVRKQMIESNPHDNLFQAVPKLDVPSTLVSYLLYDVSLDAEYVDEDFMDTDDDDDDDDDDDMGDYDDDDDDDDNDDMGVENWDHI